MDARGLLRLVQSEIECLRICYKSYTSNLKMSLYYTLFDLYVRDVMFVAWRCYYSANLRQRGYVMPVVCLYVSLPVVCLLATLREKY